MQTHRRISIEPATAKASLTSGDDSPQPRRSPRLRELPSGARAAPETRLTAALPSSFSCDHLGEDSERKDLLDHLNRLPAAVDRVVGELVKRKPLAIQIPEAFFIAEKRAIRDLDATREQHVDGTLQPDQHGPVFLEPREILRLRNRATAEGNDAGLPQFSCFADRASQLLVFHAAKLGLAVLREDLRNIQPGGVLNPRIEIDVWPADLARQ